MTALLNSKLNHLLSVLPPVEWERITPQLTWTDLPFGHIVYESGDHPEYVYFPVASTAPLLHVMENDSSGEVAIVGNEGMVDITIFMGGETTPSRAVVQSAGSVYRLSVRTLEQEFIRISAMQHLLLRYTQALTTQMVQTTVCNRRHSIGQQLCRRPLLSLSRLPSNELRTTQELIANILGVHRSGIIEAALKLQTTGLIRYNHGAIEVLSRPGLGRRAYEYYAVVKRGFDCLFPDLGAL